MTLLTSCDDPPDVGDPAAARGRHDLRRQRARRLRALAEFMEEIGILFRYATGRDYYDRGHLGAKD